MSGMRRPWFLSGLFTAIFCLHTSHLFSQDAATESKVDNSRDLLRQQMELKLQEQEAALGGGESWDEDLGEQIIVKRKPKAWTVEFSADVGETWTDNVTQVTEDSQGDFIFTHNSVFSGNYKLTDKLTLGTGFRFTAYRYSRLIIQNFDAYNATGSLSYQLPYSFTVSTGVGWTTVESKPIGDSVYEEADTNMGISKIVPLSFFPFLKDHSALFLGFQSDYRWTSPKDLQKWEQAPYAGLFYAFNPKTTMSVIYRFNYQKFQTGGRKDYNNSITGVVNWSPFDFMTVTGIANTVDNNSVGKSARNYDSITLGGTVKFHWKY